MGNALVPGSRELTTSNVAYQTMPVRRNGRGVSIPLPLGLVQLASNFPTFDPNDPNFSAARIANLALNPPFFMELSHPSDLNGDITIGVARNALSIDFADARDLLPQQPVDVAGTYSRPLFGLGLMGARTYVAPLVTLQSQVGFDDALYGVLAQGQPLLPNSSYRLSADGQSMAGTTFNLGYSGGGWGNPAGNGLYVGAYTKYIMGLALGKADTQFSLTTSDTIFGDSQPLDVGYETTTRYAPFGNVGNGVGFDTGVAYRMGALDVGLGLRDLGSSVRWNKTIVRHTTLRDSLVTDPDVTEPYTFRIPTQTTLNVGWTGSRTVLAADLTTSSWSTAVHVGAEQRLGALALRGGVLTDERSRVQYACGLGLGVSRLWVDLGLQTHNRSITGERGLTLGTSLAIR
jgi:hypothetical protein